MGSVDTRGVAATVWFSAWLKWRSSPLDCSARGRRACARAVSAVNVSLESLESRQMLAATPIISEFLAVNNAGLADKDGEYSDWVELHNPGTSDANLDGYFLTDDSSDLDKWRLPAVTLPAGGYLVVFASGKDLAVAGQQLHTSFSLDGAGEYLALVAPDRTTVLSQYAPQYPAQLGDISYGIATDVEETELVGPRAATRAQVPQDASLGMGWTDPEFEDGAWMAGTTGVGYERDTAPPQVSGFSMRMVDVNGGTDGQISDIVEAQAILNGSAPPGAHFIAFDGAADYAVINHGNGGSYGADLALPNGLGGTSSDQNAPGREDYALRATANVIIPAGSWTINVNSDDGFALRIPGVSFISRNNHSAGGLPAENDTLAFANPRGPANTFGTFTVPAGGLATTLTLDFYERGGGDEVELSFASGHQSAFNATTFSLLRDGLAGWSVKTTSSTPPPDYASLLGTDVGLQMYDQHSTVYVRIPFSTGEPDEFDPGEFDVLRLRMKYDDGFVAYLNGQEVARRNAGDGAVDWQSSASAQHADEDAIVYEDIFIPTTHLRAGHNVLAIHGLNISDDSSDLLIYPELHGLRTLESAERYFSPPTPGATNSTSDLVGVVGDTRFSVDRGFYDAPISVEIATATEGTEIRYTTDGSAPTATTGTPYAGPITISSTTILRAAAFKPGFVPSNVDTQTYIFLDDVIRQPHNPSGFPQVGTSGVHWDYGMDQRVVNDPAYSGRIVDALKSIPTMSLVMEYDDLFGSAGIYQNPGGSGINWERPGSAELIYADGSDGFQIDAGVRIYGGVSRATWYPKHTFRLLFKRQYGAGKLDFPLFQDGIMGDSAVEEFDTVILRGNFNKTWTFTSSGERTNAQYIHDSFISDMQLAMGQPGIHSTFVHLYVNGHYWGLYNPVERPEAAFAAAYMGGEKEEWDALNSSEPVDGVKTAWTAMQNIANGVAPGQPWSSSNPNPQALATPEAYAAIREYLDVENLIDYFILNIWGGNIDWDDHNWYAARKREPGAGYKFFSWDAERTLESTTYDKTEVGGTYGQADKPSRIYKQLRANPEFRLLFADHVHKHMFNGGLLTPEVAKARYKELADVIDQAIIGESARWGDYQRPSLPYTRDVEWIAEQNRLMNSYFPVRTNNVLNQFRADGLYPAVAAPLFNQHGGEVAEGFALSMAAPAGTIYYTLDGSDPRLPGGAVAPGALSYGGSVALDVTTIAAARVLSNGVWSALNKATFVVDTSALRISEIMYHPAPPAAGSPYAADDFEFIELINTGNRTLNLVGVALPDIDFTFGQVTLDAGQRIVLVKNQAAFALRYPGVAVGGTYSGSLSNSGERLQMLNARGRVILDFEYDDDWHKHTDGEGYSLVAIDPAAPPPFYGLKNNWRPSNLPLGAPGAPDPGIDPGTVVVNEVMSYGQGSDPDWIELHNTTDDAIDIGGWFLSNSAADLKKYRIEPGVVIPAKGFAVLYEDQHFGVAGRPGVATPFALSALGEGVHLSSADGSGDVAGYRASQSFGAAARGVSFGRHGKSTGGTDFTAQAAPTPGAANGAPRTGPVVINELMYNPSGTNVEYVELRNVSGAAVPLYDAQDPANTWAFTDGITFAFPAGISLPAGGSLLVVPIDPATFRARYNIHPHVPIYGPYTGALDNAGEQVELSMPGEREPGGTVPYIAIDRVNYEQAAPWPAGANGAGASLARSNPSAYGNDAAHWVAEPGGSPGYANFDTTSPAVVIDAVSPDPHVGPVDAIQIVFDEIVTEFDLADLSLVRDGGAPLSLASATLTTTDGFTYTLGNLAPLTSEPGSYTLTIHAATAGVRDLAGNELSLGAASSFEVSGNAFELTGTSGDDHFHVRRVGDQLHVWPNADGSGSPVMTVPLPMSAAFHASLGDGDDTITFDMSGGDFELAGGIHLSPSSGDDRIRLVNGDGRTLTVGLLALDGKKLDLGTAGLRALNTEPHLIESLLRTARDNGGGARWQGAGIGTSAATAHTGLAAVPQGADVLVKLTYDGDANGDGRINFDDYFQIDSNYLSPPAQPLYAQGDFNYDDQINFDDYFLIDSAFLEQGAPLAASGSAGSAPLFSTTTIAADTAPALTQSHRRTAPDSTSIFDRTVRKSRRATARR